MVKKRNRLSDGLSWLAKLALLNGIFISGVASAETLPDDQPHNGMVNGTTPHAGIDLYLDVTLNGNSVGLARFGYTDGNIYASASTLRQLGFRLPEKTSEPVYLSEISQLQIDYDVRQQTLKLTAPLKILDSETTRLNQADITSPEASTSRGMLLNYDIYAAQERAPRVSTFTELRAFNSTGVFSSTQLTRYPIPANGGSQNNLFSRLDTSWHSSFPDQLLTVTVGDTLTRSLSWSRPTRIAGIQVGTDFSLQPYLPTAPLPTFLGSATLPSSVELYINGIKHSGGEIPAGNFEINTMPTISGAGNAQVMVTDTLGRTTIQNFSFYSDQQLLRKGLIDWSAELGVVRKNYGYSSFDYADRPAFIGTWRRGISNSFTAGSHAEATDRLVNTGLSTDWVPGSGTLSTSLALSADTASRNGSLYSVGYRWSGYNLSFSTTTVVTSGHYHDVASRYGPPPPALSSNTIVGYGTKSLGNFSLSYLQFRYPQESAVRYANANWFKSVTEDIYLNAGFSQNIDTSRDSSLYLMVTVAISNRLTASSTLQRTNNKASYLLNASKTQPVEGGWGWNFAASQQSSQQSGQGEVGYLGSYGDIYAGINSMPDTHYGYAGASGALVMMAGDLFAARNINDGFAVVSTDGVTGVPVKLENNPVGTSNDQGLLLVTPLNSYQNNLLSIDPMGLPVSTRISRISAYATPANRSGVLVNFDITPVRAAQVILVDADGKVIAEGSQVRLNADQGQNTVVGFDGMAYFDALELHNSLQVTTATGACSAQFDYPVKGEGIPQIGPLTCR